MLSVLRAFSQEHGITLLKPQEEENLATTTNAMPDFEITPAIMIGFIEQLSGTLPPSPSHSATPSPDATSKLNAERPGSSLGSNAATSQANVFEARQRSAPIESGVPSTWKSRPQRVRGRSETGLAAITGTDGDVSPSVAMHFTCFLHNPCFYHFCSRHQ